MVAMPFSVRHVHNFNAHRQPYFLLLFEAKTLERQLIERVRREGPQLCTNIKDGGEGIALGPKRVFVYVTFHCKPRDL